MTVQAKPRAGSKLAWLADNLQYSNAEIVELARKAKLEGMDTARRVARMRNVLKTKHKLKASSGGKRERRPTAAARRSKPTKRPTARDAKRAAVHRLFFELGFDEVRELFDDYLAMHKQMKGDES